ncbi:hypothetical protein ColLi_09130 [Colletotrichum liriopes]|uniref:Uncharacterized protein n=1 Tax=Colletotrichum liriopes TaxID=708192 RepID=A0AA37LVS1_9PEZI|nr:hypothetical protein ColLi_09130 [Colletotrichum liriopes]
MFILGVSVISCIPCADSEGPVLAAPLQLTSFWQSPPDHLAVDSVLRQLAELNAAINYLVSRLRRHGVVPASAEGHDRKWDVRRMPADET